MSHSILAPSSAGRWRLCTGSIQFSHLNQDTSASREGTEAHHWAKVWLRKGEPAAETPEPMRKPLRVYVDHVHSVTRNPQIEQRVNIPAIHSACYGTTDAMFRDGSRLWLWDLKYGRMLVEVHDNWQLICYASGFAQPGDTITLTIVQPRVWHVDGYCRSVTYTYEQLQSYVVQLVAAAEQSMSAGAKLVAGAHCRYCPGLHVCPAARRMALSFPVEAENIPNDAIASELDALREQSALIQYRLDALERDAMDRMRAGARLSDCSVESSRGRLTWAVPADDITALAHATGIDLHKPITPIQARDAGLSPDVLKHYTIRRNSGLRIATGADDRAREIFKP